MLIHDKVLHLHYAIIKLTQTIMQTFHYNTKSSLFNCQWYSNVDYFKFLQFVLMLKNCPTILPGIWPFLKLTPLSFQISQLSGTMEKLDASIKAAPELINLPDKLVTVSQVN